MDRNSFAIQTTINDRCEGVPGDGYGAYLYLEITFTTGQTATLTPAIAKDTRGCTEDPLTTPIIGVDLSSNITRIRMRLRECDNVNGSIRCSTASIDIAYSSWKDNPYT